ncbi:MAG: hypothetical protein NTY39_09245 [Campylobacterales bacterium]|nr:hypothetical protein [Campylobacterales bacterium]
MKRFRRLFALLFILSLFVGVVHQLSHAHHDDSCEVCLLSHSSALANEPIVLSTVTSTFEPFACAPFTQPAPLAILTRSRSPPLS